MPGSRNPQSLTLADLYDLYERKMQRYATILAGDPYQAEDLVQETFLRAMPHLAMLSGLEPNQRLAWLRRVLKNRFIDQQRVLQREQELAAQIILETEREDLQDADLPMLTQDLLAMASEKDREMLTQRYILGMTSQEIGQQLGVPAATIRSRLHLARKRLRARQNYPGVGFRR